ncbi:MAG: hypothetical protein KDE05_11815 [Parvularculaceae bacterium]|nr:hypothetical protein [Parvularculaceae bacterium]
MIQETAGLFEQAIIAPPSDRRLSQRLLSVWAQAARGSYPSWADMRAIDLGADWNWVFVVDLKQSVGFPYFSYLGSELAKLSAVYLQGQTDWTLSLLDMATATIDAAVACAGPNHHERELTLCDGRKVLFRCMTAPLADDGETISHVVGCASGKLAEEKAPRLRIV